MITTATLNRTRRGFTAAEREMILDARCHYCNSMWPSEIDHLIPFSRGGSEDLDNLVPACARCNLEKSDMTPDEWQAWREDQGRTWPVPSRETAVDAVLSGLVLDELESVAARVKADDDETFSWLNQQIDDYRAGDAA